MSRVINHAGGGGSNIKLLSITIATQPTKTSYFAGESFVADGMVVNATYTGGLTGPVTGYTIEPSGALAAGTTSITVKYSEGGMEKTATVAITVTKRKLTRPTQLGSLSWNGSQQSPNWKDYDETTMTKVESKQSDAGDNYQTTFGLRYPDLYTWDDNTTADVTRTWSIAKVPATLSLNKTDVTFNTTTKSDTVTATFAGGTLMAESQNTSIVTVGTVNQSTGAISLACVGENSGSAKVKVNVTPDKNHTAPAEIEINVNAAFVDATFNNNDWATVRSVSDAGNASHYWAVGDRHAETLNGTVGNLSLSNKVVYPFIVDFDHNLNKEFNGGHTITLEFARESLTGTKAVSFIDSNYSPDKGWASTTSGFVMNTSNTNSGGWNNSYMRKTIMPAFANACSQALRDNAKTVTIYSDNTGGGSDTASYVTATQDKFYLASEFEYHGTRTYANSAEQNYQTQLAYYKSGNSKIHYKVDSVATAVFLWCRSVRSSSGSSFCRVNSNGDASIRNASYSLAVSPLVNI